MVPQQLIETALRKQASRNDAGRQGRPKAAGSVLP